MRWNTRRGPFFFVSFIFPSHVIEIMMSVYRSCSPSFLHRNKTNSVIYTWFFFSFKFFSTYYIYHFLFFDNKNLVNENQLCSIKWNKFSFLLTDTNAHKNDSTGNGRPAPLLAEPRYGAAPQPYGKFIFKKTRRKEKLVKKCFNTKKVYRWKKSFKRRKSRWKKSNVNWINVIL